MFKTVGLITKPNSPESESVAASLISFLKKMSIKVVSEQQEIKDYAEMIIVLGGDGTFVGTARRYIEYEIPLLGVNLGRLGFLTDIDSEQMFESLKAVLGGDYRNEQRFMLECECLSGKFVALNDVVVHRSNAPRMVNASVYIDNSFVCDGSADGLIVSTPTGSTAYALSSGGPIINTGVNAMSLVYISPHSMSYRPIIVSSESVIRIRLSEPQHGANVMFDGQVSIPLKANQDIIVSKHNKSLRLIHPDGYDFFGILRNKLHWGK